MTTLKSVSKQFQNESAKSVDQSEKKTDKYKNGKVFVVRDSYYTTLLQNDHLKSVYYMFVAIFILILLDTVSHDLLTSGRVYFGVRTIKQGFANIHMAFAVWSFLHILVIGLYYALQAWAQVLRTLKGNTVLRNFWNYWCIISFIGIQLTIFCIGTVACLSYDLPFASASALLMETLRLVMKTHAFVRTNVPKLLKEDDAKSKRTSIQLAPLTSYLYYLFAPTLIYQDSYPRTANIRWKLAIKSLLEFVAIIFLYSFIYERYILTNYQDFGLEKVTKKEVIDKLFAMIVPSSLTFFSTGYVILHCWLNFTAELLRFGDRLFYKDWWTSANYSMYYRSWNIVVHEWFYEYVYKDSYKYIFKGSKVGSSLLVFYLSALMHEYVLGFAQQMFYPAMFIEFGGLGVMLFFTTSKLPTTVGKIFIWFSLLFGNTCMLCIYSMEFFARKNSATIPSGGWMQQLTQTPISWSVIE